MEFPGTTTNAGLTSLCLGPLVIDPTNPETVYAGTANGGVFKSDDGGQSWSRVPGLFAGIFALVIAPTSPATTVYAAGFGVYKTTDGGQTWTSASVGITSQLVRNLAIDPTNPAVVFAGTEGGGVFKTTDSGVTWQQIGAK